MKKIYKELIKEYSDFNNCYKYAFVGIPKGFSSLEKPFYGTLNSFLKKYPNLKIDKTIPTVLFMHGSKGFNKGTVYRKWIVEEANCIFFAPNSFRIKNRPTYKTPTKLKNYEKVHKFRQAEITYNLEKLKSIPFVDSKHIFLMGNSEGGLAAAAYKSKEFKGRIVTAYSCENGYYSKDFKIGANKKEPFLNIIGTHDEYFAKDSKTNRKYKVQGHCTKALMHHKNAKVIILPQTRHDITTNIYVKEDIINFLNFYSKE